MIKWQAENLEAVAVEFDKRAAHAQKMAEKVERKTLAMAYKVEADTWREAASIIRAAELGPQS